jgi:hypothetical protein
VHAKGTLIFLVVAATLRYQFDQSEQEASRDARSKGCMQHGSALYRRRIREIH